MIPANSLSTNFNKLTNVDVGEVKAAEIVGSFIYLAVDNGNILIFVVLPDQQLRQVTFNSKINCADISYDRNHRMLYFLDERAGVYVYATDERGYLLEHDFIELTHRYSDGYRIQASGKVLLIAFRQRSHYNVLELNYNAVFKQVTLVRYFKFKDELTDIYIQTGALLALGRGFIGMFPLSIHPQLIKEEFNGHIQPISLVAIRPYGEMIFGVSNSFVAKGTIQRSKYK